MKQQAVGLSANPLYEPVGCKAIFGPVHLGIYFLLKRNSPSLEKGGRGGELLVESGIILLTRR